MIFGWEYTPVDLLAVEPVRAFWGLVGDFDFLDLDPNEPGFQYKLADDNNGFGLVLGQYVEIDSVRRDVIHFNAIDINSREPQIVGFSFANGLD